MTHQPDELTQWMESLSWEFDQSLNIWCGPDGQSFLMPDQAAFFHSHLTKELAKREREAEKPLAAQILGIADGCPDALQEIKRVCVQRLTHKHNQEKR